MAAIQLVLSLFRSGDSLLVPEDIYGGTYRLFDFFLESFGVTPIYALFRTVEETAAMITDGQKRSSWRHRQTR
ncbi:cystathionine beta-lyase/cystathionine gamma-synthase [Bacillus capparidis]|uniref:Cystathionine beta-lyase/cystathionine gamma-synthase n=1 Tax=Bacillus capparidis TaxID=1840411 RepID=A0ABS4CWS9_9BACI|nr:cystathionine beta-lyase/cystathionine gamma-synthase [Bacillus capparidis]